MKNKNQVLRFTLLTFFVAIELLLALTPLGYLNVGVISITLMHLPVIFVALFMGMKEGMLVGFVFGLASFLRATFLPNITSFCFTPFYAIGNIHGNFASLVIAFGPRIALGFVAGLLHKLCHNQQKEWFKLSILSIFCTFLHTIMVMGLIWLFFGEDFATVAKISVKAVLLSVLASNGLLEMIVAGIVIPFLYQAVKPIRQRLVLE